MKIMVQNRRTNAFLAEDAGWVKELNSARRFRTSLEALRFCFERRLENLDLVVRYAEAGRTDLRLPLC